MKLTADCISSGGHFFGADRMGNIDRGRIKEIGELFPGTVAIYRANGDSLETLYASDELPSILGMDPEEYHSISGQNAIDIIIPEDRKKVIAALRSCIDGTVPYPDIFYRVYNKKMDVDWVHLRAKKIGILDGGPVFVCSFTNASVETDIYQGIINHTNSMIYVSDRDSYEILYANNASRKAGGENEKVLFGTKCYEYILNRTSPCEDCLMNQVKENQCVNVTRYNAQKKIWEHVYGEFVDWCGHQGFVQHIEDVSDQETARRDMESAEKRLEMAVTAAQLNTWQYSVKEDCVTYGSDAFKNYGLSRTIKHVPESLMKYVVEEDREKLREVYRKIKAGEQRIKTDICTVNPKTKAHGYLRIMYLTEKDENGVPAIAYGASFDITAQVHEKERFYTTLQAMLTANPDAQCSYLVNLTKNQYQEGHGTSAYVIASLQAEDVDGVFANFLKLMPVKEEKEKFSELFNRTSLLNAFTMGRSSFSLDYRRRTETGSVMWVRTFLHLLKNPSNEDVEGVVYSIDISKEKRRDEIFRIMTQQDYDYAALLHVSSNQIEVLSINHVLTHMNAGQDIQPGAVFNFDDQRQDMVQTWIAEEDKEYYLKNSDVKHITRGLDQDGHYELTIRGHYSDRPEEYMCRKIQHYYLDDMKDLILLLQSDVTQVYLQQQEDIERAIREADRVQEIMDSIATGISVLYMPDPDHLQFRYVNKQMFRILGFSETGNDLSAKKYEDILVQQYVENGFAGVHPEDLQRLKKEFHDHYNDQHFLVSDYRTKANDGEYHWLREELNLHEVTKEGNVFYATYLDVSDEHHLQEELEAQRRIQMQKTLKDTMNNLPTNFALFRILDDNTLQPEQYSDEFCKMGGYVQEDDLFRDDAYGGVHPEDKDGLSKTIFSHLNDNRPFNCIYRIIGKDKKYFWVSVNFNKFVFDDQRYLYAAYTNIDSLKKQEAWLAEQYNEAQAYLISSSATSVAARRINLTRNFIESVQGRSPLKEAENITDYDAYVKVLTGIVAAGFDAHQLAEFYDRGNLIKSYEIGERSMSIEYPYRTGIGEINWCHNTISLIKRPYSNDIIAFSIVTDISQEKLTADIISTLVQKKYDSVGTVDAHTGKLVAYISNRRVLNSVMIEKGDSFEKIVHDYNEKFVIERDREMCNKVLTLDNILKHLNEHDRYAVFFSVYEDDAVKMKQKEFFYLDKENQMVSFVSSDITEAHDKQVKQEEILRIALKQAEQANAAKSSFLSRMSHDMRTPLNGIIGLTYLTEEMDLPQKAQENLQKIDTSSKFLLGLINDILDMAKAESGKVVLKPEPYSIDEFNKYLDAVIRPLCKERKLNFVLDESGVMTRIPLADKLRINQILFNVLSNAVKYTPEGGTITYTIQASALPHDRVQIIHTISDTGIGMSEEFQKKLFEPFTQEEQNESGRIQGTGLGLAIVKRMINLMGGTIQVKSTLGEGSTFIITLDFDTVAPGTQPVKIEAEDGEESFNMEGRRILLCEDNQLNQEIAKMLLTQKGIEVDIADNGKVGVDRFSKAAPQTYDLILMDIRMPVMNGYEAAKAIRQLDTEDAKSIPIIAMTADAYSEDVQKAKDAGMNGHIAKPIDPNHLYETLQKIMKHDA